MTDQRVIQFEYQQSLFTSSDKPGWSEDLEVSVRILSAAITSGWYRENFGQRATDFMILTTIVMHARPLKGADLDLLVALGMAAPKDAGRLYARVTDIGLADELGLHRTTVDAGAKRLAAAGFITVAPIPKHLAFRDSKGQFAGAKIYLVAGDLQNKFLEKAVNPVHRVQNLDTDGRVVMSDMDNIHRVGLTDTVKPENLENHHRVGLTDTVKPEDDPHRVGFTAESSGQTNINIGCVEGEGVFLSAASGAKNDSSAIFTRFEQLRGGIPYNVTRKDKQAVTDLLKSGYTIPEIIAGIERSAQRAGGSLAKARWFTFVIGEIRAQPPQHAHPRPAAPSPAGEEDHPSAAPTAPAAPTAAPPPTHPAGRDIPPEILTVFALATGHPADAGEQTRLSWLYDEFAPQAETQGNSAWDWIMAALKATRADAKAPISYARSLIQRRLDRADKTRKPSRPAASRPGVDAPAALGDAGDAPPQTGTAEGESSALVVIPPDGGAIQLGAFTIPPPVKRKSGYVTPAEISQAAIYEVARKMFGGQNGKS